ELPLCLGVGGARPGCPQLLPELTKAPGLSLLGKRLVIVDPVREQRVALPARHPSPQVVRRRLDFPCASARRVAPLGAVLDQAPDHRVVRWAGAGGVGAPVCLPPLAEFSEGHLGPLGAWEGGECLALPASSEP